MTFKIRIVLDVREDVIRTIAIESKSTLEDLHEIIIKAFGFDVKQMASFYKTNDNWLQGEEIPLISIDEYSETLSMSSYSIYSCMKKVGDKLIYVYDFMEMWTFFVELIEISKKKKETLPDIILSVGKIPKKSPKKNFKLSKNDLTEELDKFEDFENTDTENY